MSFWNGLGKVAEMAFDSMQEKAANIQLYKDQYERLDDKELIEKMKSTSGNRKLACISLLQDRGYGNK